MRTWTGPEWEKAIQVVSLTLCIDLTSSFDCAQPGVWACLLQGVRFYLIFVYYTSTACFWLGIFALAFSPLIQRRPFWTDNLEAWACDEPCGEIETVWRSFDNVTLRCGKTG